jgi:hypothetical protein
MMRCRCRHHPIRCIEYLRFSTNNGRYLEVGNKQSPAPLKSNKPVAGAFLGFFKGFTDAINANAATGALQQLQLFWCLRECEEPANAPRTLDAEGKVVSEGGGAKKGDGKKKQQQAGGKKQQQAGGKKQQQPGSEGELPGDSTSAEGTFSGLLDPLPGHGGDLLSSSTTVVDDGSWGSKDAGSNATADGSWAGKEGVDATGGNIIEALLAKHGKGKNATGLLSGLFGKNGTQGGGGKKNKNPLQAMKQQLLDKKQRLLGGPLGGGNATGDICLLADLCPGSNGTCPLPSCGLNGAGKEVLTMMCYGTNIIPNPLLDATFGNPCANLACQLNVGNCTSGPMGLGGVCHGKVVSMSNTVPLHPAGAPWVGYPCMEHKGPLLALLPKLQHADYDSNGKFVAKAWKTCDCGAGLGVNLGLSTLLGPGGNMSLPAALEEKLNATADLISSFLETKVTKLRLSPVVEKVTELIDGITEALSMFELSMSMPLDDGNSSAFGGFGASSSSNSSSGGAFGGKLGALKGLLPSLTVNVTELPVMQQGVLGMSLPDVMAQWATAFATKAPLVKYAISSSKLNALRAFVPGFEVPSVLVANVSAPLMKGSDSAQLPVFAIPDESLASVATLLPGITALPVLCMPKAALGGLLNVTSGGILDLQNLTHPSMQRVVERVLSVFPPAEWAVNIISGKFADVASKWMTGVLMDERIPTVNATREQMADLSAVLPGLNKTQPTLMLWDASSLMFTKPRLPLLHDALAIATTVVPNDLAANVSATCPLLTPGLPALLVPAGFARKFKNATLPKLTLGAVAPADLKATLDRLLSSLHGHAAFNLSALPDSGSILNISLPHPMAKLEKLGNMLAAGLDGVLPGGHPGGMGSVLDAFAGFEALKKNLTGLAGMKNFSGSPLDADQAFVNLVAGNFSGIKIIPGNFTGLLNKKEEGLAALKHLLPGINVLKSAKKAKAKVLNITISP